MKYLIPSAFFLLLFFTNCSLKNNQQVKEQSSFYHMKLYNKDKILKQNQFYSYKKDKKGVEYFYENGKFVSDSSIKASAYVEFENNQYKRIEIKFDNGRFKTDVTVKLEGDKYVSYNKNKRKDSFMLKEINLFSGPNPIFDYLNRRIIKKNAINSVASDSVNLLGIMNGSLSKNLQHFTFEKDIVKIDKPSLKSKSEIYLTKSDLGMSKYIENKNLYVFSKSEKGFFHKSL